MTRNKKMCADVTISWTMESVLCSGEAKGEERDKEGDARARRKRGIVLSLL